MPPGKGEMFVRHKGEFGPKRQQVNNQERGNIILNMRTANIRAELRVTMTKEERYGQRGM